jgi:hypothetical protein
VWLTALGRYLDRRNQGAIDTSNTIWIIATNAVDDIILDFCEVHHKDVFQSDDPMRQTEMMNDLSVRLRKQLKSEFGVSTMPSWSSRQRY